MATSTLADGGWDRNGPLAILVNSHSAVCRLDQKKLTLIFPVNEDHSATVKFTRNYAYVKIACQKLVEIAKIDPHHQSGAEDPETFREHSIAQ
ncbi:hypothetical protein B0T14DRAFT_567260 [Immersiella caudata]|uniref:Uncharacterized protein n=1 Tax=Immersiella caudata TaxID=314043 RepID=A0AA39WS00_9PEZI|nr:hypothetical protein B0T14DRAFT_567260 [Immersiella caudata]